MGYWLGGEKVGRKSWVHKVVAENWKNIGCRNMGQWYAIEQLMEHAIIYYTAPGD